MTSGVDQASADEAIELFEEDEMKKDNVIDMTERIQSPEPLARLKHLKVRFDLEQAKVAISTSLLSVVVLVTLANNNLMSTVTAETVPATQATRGIASVSTGTSDAEDSFVRELAKKDLSAASGVGRKPTALENLAFGQLEGRYAVRLVSGKLSEIEFSREKEEGPKQIGDLNAFVERHRDLLPVSFDRMIVLDRESSENQSAQTFQLVDGLSRPVAKVRFDLDGEGRMLSMRVAQARLDVK